MTTETSAAGVVVLRAPARLYAGLPAAGDLPASDVARKPARDGAIPPPAATNDRGILRRLTSALGDVLGIVAIAYALPLVILAIGIPIALLVRLVLWIVGAL